MRKSQGKIGFIYFLIVSALIIMSCFTISLGNGKLINTEDKARMDSLLININIE